MLFTMLFRHSAIDHLNTVRGVIRKDGRTLLRNHGPRSCDVLCQNQTAIALITGAPSQLEGNFFISNRSAVILHGILVCVRFVFDKVFGLLSTNIKFKKLEVVEGKRIHKNIVQSITSL
jgi:hypothetical protein